jgi:hypothetical protein
LVREHFLDKKKKLEADLKLAENECAVQEEIFQKEKIKLKKKIQKITQKATKAFENAA